MNCMGLREVLRKWRDQANEMRRRAKSAADEHRLAGQVMALNRVLDLLAGEAER
jgi:P2-related tail formation protein